MPRMRSTESQEAGRSKRVLLGGTSLKLDAPKRNGYVRRWFNDAEGRVETAEQAGYSFVHDGRAESEQPVRVRRRVGTNADGTPLYAYLMEKPEEFYQEDQALKRQPLDEIDEAIFGGQVRGAQARDTGNFYSRVNITRD